MMQFKKNVNNMENMNQEIKYHLQIFKDIWIHNNLNLNFGQLYILI